MSKDNTIYQGLRNLADNFSVKPSQGIKFYKDERAFFKKYFNIYLDDSPLYDVIWLRERLAEYDKMMFTGEDTSQKWLDLLGDHND